MYLKLNQQISKQLVCEQQGVYIYIYIPTLQQYNILQKEEQ